MTDTRMLPVALVVWAVATVGLAWGWQFSWLLGVLAVATALVLAFRSLRWRPHAVLVVALGSLATWWIAMVIHASASDPLRQQAEHGAIVTLRVEVSERPKPLRTQGFGSRQGGTDRVLVPAGDIVVLAQASGWADLLPGQSLTVTGRAAPARGGDLTVAVVQARGSPTEVTPAPVWQRAAAALRSGLRRASAVLPEEQAGLVPGLVVGDTTNLSPRVSDEFTVAGMTHLLAVSGANLAIVAGAVLFTIRLLGWGPRVAGVGAGLAVIGFVIAGLSRGDTGVRGAVMSLLAGLAASLFGGFDLFGLELGAVSAVLAFLLLRHPAHRAASWIGLMLLTLAGAVVLQAMQPQASLILVWPLAAAAACAALTGAGTAEGPLGGIGRVLAFLITILGLAWVGGFFHTLLQGLDVPEALGAVLLLAALLLWPIAWRADPHDRPWITASDTLLVVALCMALWEHWTSPWSARHPRADMPLYVVDQTGGGAYRFSPFKPDRWVASILKADGGSIVRRAFPGISANGGPREGWAAPARAAGAPPVVISVIRGRDGVVTIKAPVPADGRLDLQLRTSAEVSDARIDGRPAAILAKAGDWTRMVWQAAPEGVSVSFKPAAPGAVEIRYAEWIPAWPAGAAPLPAPPRNAMAWSYAGATVVTGAQKVAW